MKIELQLKSVTIRPQDTGKNWHDLLCALQSYVPAHKPVKRRTPRKRETVAYLIDRIIEDIQK